MQSPVGEKQKLKECVKGLAEGMASAIAFVDQVGGVTNARRFLDAYEKIASTKAEK